MNTRKEAQAGTGASKLAQASNQDDMQLCFPFCHGTKSIATGEKSGVSETLRSDIDLCGKTFLEHMHEFGLFDEEAVLRLVTKSSRRHLKIGKLMAARLGKTRKGLQIY